MDRSALAYWESGQAGPVRPMSAPIVPAPEDTEYVEDRILRAAGERPLRALLLGMTRSLATLRWPAGSSLVAVEWSAAMIRRFWSAEGVPGESRVVRADWRELPLAAAAFDVAAGDGCCSVLGSLRDATLAGAEIGRVLRPGGTFYLRCFTRPPNLTVERVFEALHAGRIDNVFLLQWLLAMAVHGDTREGVALDAVWRAWSSQVADPAALFARRGWDGDSGWTLARWKGIGVRYSFPTVEELVQGFAPHLELVERHVPGYAWGECFPTLVMQAAAPRR